MGGMPVIGVASEPMANHRNECCSGTRESAIAAVDKAQFAPELDIGYFD
jgi:hypothetical protein